MPFPFYRKLTARQKAIYRQSDDLPAPRLPRPGATAPLVARLEADLAAGRPVKLRASATALSAEILAQLGAPGLTVRVLSVRPSRARSELHGLYERDAHGQAVLSVWMRTATHGRVVAFRTFLRTLVHELGHHLDYELHGLADSFHTEGFFRRESGLVRQLAPKPTTRPSRPSKPASRTVVVPKAPEPTTTTPAKKSRPAQLALPL